MILAATEAYATAEEYRRALDPERSDSASDDVIDGDLLGVSRFLDKSLGRFFGQEGTLASPVARQYDLCGANYDVTVNIDDFAIVTTVALDEDGDDVAERTLATSDYRLLPRNAALGSEPHPYTKIALYPARGLGSRAVYNITTESGPLPAVLHVSGIAGWPAVPQAIIMATIQLTALWRLESPRATTQINELTTVTSTAREAQSIIREVMNAYRKSWVFR